MSSLVPQGLHQALAHPLADKRLEILRLAGLGGSISAAARQAGVSYKAAWQALDTLSNLAGTTLLLRAVGGSGGGGVRLTPAGEQLLQAAERLGQARQQLLAGPMPGALALRTSMRNALPCTVLALQPQAGALRVGLSLADGQVLQARITRESAQLLGLQPGLAVLALCKATAVEVRAPDAAPTAPGLNRLQGQVSRLSRARAGGEVALRLGEPGAGGAAQTLVGFGGGAADPGLALRGPAMAWLAESAVVIALGS